MKFDLHGYDADNLIKTLYLKRITLYNVNILAHNHISFEIEDKNEHKIKRYIKNFKVKKTPKFFRQIPKFCLMNLGLILGVFFGSLFFIFASNFTWRISVYGTKELSEKEIINVLKNNGVKVGKINLQSSEDIETILLNNYDRIAQVSVIRKGTHIVINLSEKLVYNPETYQPICAKYNGIITKIEVVTGTVNVKIGDYVNAGDMLVLPFNLTPQGEQIPVRPMAEIEAKIFVVNANIVNKEEIVLTETGKTTIEYKYLIFNHAFYNGKNKNKFELFKTQSYVENVTPLIPLKREVITYYELMPTTIIHNLETEKNSYVEQFVDAAKNTLPQGCTVLDESVASEIKNDCLYVFVNHTLLGPII